MVQSCEYINVWLSVVILSWIKVDQAATLALEKAEHRWPSPRRYITFVTIPQYHFSWNMHPLRRTQLSRGFFGCLGVIHSQHMPTRCLRGGFRCSGGLRDGSCCGCAYAALPRRFWENTFRLYSGTVNLLFPQSGRLAHLLQAVLTSVIVLR